MLLQLTDVTKYYRSPEGHQAPPVLRGLSLRVDRGETVAVVGPSGCGKSTLLNIIGALDTPTSGQVRLDGEDLGRLDPDELARVRNRHIGLVFQNHHLLPQCSALENVLVPTLVERRGAERTARTERARALLDQVGLGSRTSHRPGQLSGGECQRIAVVRALVNEPKLLLADEPTGSLDGVSADALADLLLELNRQQGVTLIVVTHAMHLAERLDRTLELRAGHLAARPETS
jgi:predicted ABC-type transport system involved in lysophospholipase L1 biosynthesis ATPase subunit